MTGVQTCALPIYLIPCSLIGLHNVLSGVEYVAIGEKIHCLVRLEVPNVEVVWKENRVETVMRLTVSEYAAILRNVTHGSRRAA